MTLSKVSLLNGTCAFALVVGTLLGATASSQAAGKLTIDSWRNDDIEIWRSKIIPAFNAKHPDIEVVFEASPPAEYNASLNAKLAGGTAADLITCRPFDTSLDLYKKGHLSDLTGLSGLENFSDVAKSAWQTDDGKATFCLPMASVIHGFMYNKEIFEELGLSVPTTRDEFYATLKTIKDKSRYTPLVMGTADQWEAATMGFQNIGPNYWKGEEGRKALIAGTHKLTDKPYVDTLAELARWGEYLGKGFKAQKYPDSQNLFTLGRGAIYAAGSWDIATFNSQADFKFGAFGPLPAKGEDCYISDHTDIALGINPKTNNMDAAKTFLSWMASAEFADIYANSLPGFFSLSNHEVKLSDPVAQEFVSLRGKCKSTIRNSYQILSRGTPNLETELWNASVQVINGTMTPQDAAKKLQDGLDSWYKPGM